MDHITPKNWSQFQHYRDRSPTWLKLHRTLLDDFDFHCLPLASKAIAPLLWLLASEYEGGRIPLDYERIAFRLRMSGKDAMAAIKPLIDRGFFLLEQSASDLLEPCLPREREEKERETEEEREGETDTSGDVMDVFTHWQATMGKNRAVLDDKRKRLIRARLKDGYSPQALMDAITGYSLSPFHMGLNDKGIRYDSLELILRDAGKVDQGISFKRTPPKPMSKADLQAAKRKADGDAWEAEMRGEPIYTDVIEGEVLNAR